MMMARIRVLIADDHPIFRSGLASVLATQPDFEIVGEAATGAEAVTRVASCHPDLVLMDLRMPIQSGVSAIEAIHRTSEARIVVLTTYATDGEILRAIEAGAVGYLLKDVPHDELFRALRAVARGERYLAPAVTERLMSRCQQGERLTLTEREIAVLNCVARGSSNKEIAATLDITEPTVKAHLVHIFGKLNVENRTSAVHVAIARGLIEV
jgi:DNA-binding NarL/FixJ family response regulator